MPSLDQGIVGQLSALSPISPPALTLRVLAVLPGSNEGSSFIFARRQIADMERAGIRVHMFNFQERTSLKGIIREWQRLRREIRQFRPVIVHAQYGTITAFLCALASRTPLVVTYRGSDLNGCPGIGLFRNYLGVFLSQLAALRAAGVICVSSTLKNKLWWGRNKVSIIPSGVNTELFRPVDKDRARAVLGWGEHEKIVLLNAGKEPVLKGLDLAQQSVDLAKRSMGPIRLVVLTGDAAPEEVPSYINAADCVLLSSVSEGSPNIVKEALACDVPVVAVDVGDVKQLLTGVWPSAVTNHRDPKELAEALEDVMRLGIRCNGRQMIERISLKRTTSAICIFYQALFTKFIAESDLHPG